MHNRKHACPKAEIWDEVVGKSSQSVKAQWNRDVFWFLELFLDVFRCCLCRSEGFILPVAIDQTTGQEVSQPPLCLPPCLLCISPSPSCLFTRVRLRRWSIIWPFMSSISHQLLPPLQRSCVSTDVPLDVTGVAQHPFTRWLCFIHAGSQLRSGRTLPASQWELRKPSGLHSPSGHRTETGRGGKNFKHLMDFFWWSTSQVGFDSVVSVGHLFRGRTWFL